jgi:hypothetical protein
MGGCRDLMLGRAQVSAERVQCVCDAVFLSDLLAQRSGAADEARIVGGRRDPLAQALRR